VRNSAADNATRTGPVGTGTATPEGGWSVSAERKNGMYQVEFKRGDDNEVKIIATCAEGGGVRFAPGS